MRGRSKPGTYRGIKMRSRVEMRYAEMLDIGDCRWQYEGRHLRAPGGGWLPDFWVVQDLGLVAVEVKASYEDLIEALPKMRAAMGQLALDRPDEQTEAVGVVVSNLNRGGGGIHWGTFYYGLDGEFLGRAI